MPERIQRRRAKGWRMPPNTVYVGRPSKWGSPWKVGAPPLCACRAPCSHGMFYVGSADEAVRLFRLWARNWRNPRGLLGRLPELRGKNLACWCPLDQPCHADVLLEIANRETL